MQQFVRILSISFFILIAACGGAVSPVSQLSISSVVPENGETDVPSNQVISVRFVEELDETSLSSESIHLMPVNRSNSSRRFNFSTESGREAAEIINVDVSFDIENKTLTLTPKSILRNGASYSLHIAGVRLRNGRLITFGTDAIDYSFTVTHVHEAERVFFDQTSGVEVRFQAMNYGFDNHIVQHDEYRTNNLGERELEFSRFYNQDLPTGGTVEMYEINSMGSLVRYEKLIDTNQGEIIATFVSQDGFDFNVESWWSSPRSHSDRHEISLHYRALTETREEVSIQDPRIGFRLQHAFLQESDHSLDLPVNNMFPYRHIVYSELGDDGKIDFDDDGNPVPINDVIAEWHTREYQHGLRTYDWTWQGQIDHLGNRTGVSDIRFDENDKAIRLSVMEYDGEKRPVRQTTYEDLNGKTRVDWVSLLNSAEIFDFRIAWRDYYYDPMTGNLTEMQVVRTCQMPQQTANTAVGCAGFASEANFYLYQRSIYESN